MSSRTLAWIAVIGALLFVTMAGLVRAGVTAGLDAGIMQAVHEHSSAGLVYVALALSTLGTVPAALVPALACAAWAVWRRDYAAAAVLGIIGLGSEAINVLLKQSFQRSRPELWPRVELASFAFPSGHAMSSVALFGTMALVIARARPSATRALWVITPLVAVSIGLSRIVLGVHWPSDVLAGWAAGTATLSIGAVGLLRYPR